VKRKGGEKGKGRRGESREKERRSRGKGP